MLQIPMLDESGLSADLQSLFVEAEQKGAPDRNLYRVLAHCPSIMQGFAQVWKAAFDDGILDLRLKELVRIKIADMYGCGY